MNTVPDSKRWRLSVAPMMDWTDRHCRYFHRLITKNTLLYTEMVTTGALLHGDVPRHLDFSPEEHPVALQLGGSEPEDLAKCAKLGEQWGYSEINLNCGCPSERVQRGAFGACLMREAELVRDCVKAMVDAVGIPVTVKHRIGIDHTEDTPQSYPFLCDFVGTVAEGGCQVFIVHARNAWLKGLSPKENRERPPLRYELVHRLKRDFPQLTICLNGGITTNAEIAEQLQHVDGVMIGREAYHNPWVMADWDAEFLGATGFEASDSMNTRTKAEKAMISYMESLQKASNSHPEQRPTHWHAAARHMMGLYNGLPGARKWRQVWSDHRLKSEPPANVMRLAHEAAGWTLA